MFKKTLLAIGFLSALGLLFWPRAQAENWEFYPGISGDGPFGPTCYCPTLPYTSCSCAMIVKEHP